MMPPPRPRSLPAFLDEVEGLVRRHASSNRGTDLLAGWQEYVARAVEDVPGLHYESEGTPLHLGDLSPGCRACQDGTWDCIFLTRRCNLQCSFCLSPIRDASDPDWHGSVLGDGPAEILAHYRRLRIGGVSFSGGEPFLAPEKLVDWVARIRTAHPWAYYWVYTNGLLASEALQQRLAALGVDEIRFNLAATGYLDPAVLANVRAAARLFPRVTVEIPAIPDDAQQLLASLQIWQDAGVRHLNLHELLYEPHSNSAAFSGPRCAVSTPDGHESAYDPRSRELALAVLREASGAGMALSVNVCSLQSKLRQLRGRRRNIARVFKEEHEELVADELLSYCLFDERGTLLFVHPERLAEMRRTRPELVVARLARLAPLSRDEAKRWTQIAWIDVPAGGAV